MLLQQFSKKKKNKGKKSGKNMMIVAVHDDARDVEFFVWQKDIEACEEILQAGKLRGPIRLGPTVPRRHGDEPHRAIQVDPHIEPPR